MQKVFVGLSGGVDSAVSAALLKQQGYDVTGVFIKIWQPEFTECTWQEDRLDAMRVAAALEIPFKEIDLSVEYKKEVVENMLDRYARGITPNPDVLCNRHIKFGSFWEWARGQGADLLATGHHAQVKEGKLYRGHDKNKDQSYFLWQLTKEDLAHTLMPVGSMDKAEVRHLAEKWNIPVAKKPDSQGLCFVGDVDIPTFLSRYIDAEEGAVLNTKGEVIGEHKGAVFYTIGQRHGFTLTSQDTDRTPVYVCEVNVQDNTIIVSDNPMSAARTNFTLAEMNFTHPPEGALKGQVRYRQEPQTCAVENREKPVVVFDEPQIAAAGQSVVLYKENHCTGGGIIE